MEILKQQFIERSTSTTGSNIHAFRNKTFLKKNY